jgi:hypothetical protein
MGEQLINARISELLRLLSLLLRWLLLEQLPQIDAVLMSDTSDSLELLLRSPDTEDGSGLEEAAYRALRCTPLGLDQHLIGADHIPHGLAELGVRHDLLLALNVIGLAAMDRRADLRCYFVPKGALGGLPG